jgi:hypothetical protein
MKKIKLMLLSLALFAVVGAALAFKAKYAVTYCTTLAQSGVACKDLTCPNRAAASTTIGGVGNFVCTTPPNGSGQCPEIVALPCADEISTKLTTDGGE